MVIRVIVFMCFLMYSTAEEDCPNSNRDTNLNLHSWKYYEDLDEMFFFYKNLSNGAWLMGSNNNAFLGKGSATEEPIVITDGSTSKMYIIAPIPLDLLVDTTLVECLRNIVHQSEGYDFDEGPDCLYEEFKETYDSIAWTAGSKGTVKDLFSLKETFASPETGAAKEFYDKEGSITLKKDVMWIVSVIQAVGELFRSNTGALRRLVKEKDLDFSEEKIFNSETPKDAIEELLKEISQVEDLKKVIGNEEEAKTKITAALKEFYPPDENVDKNAKALVNEFFK